MVATGTLVITMCPPVVSSNIRLAKHGKSLIFAADAPHFPAFAQKSQ